MSDTREPVRIAMWSGPRNISTAMMRSFENRADCAVSDEPFYAAYLYETGLAHPMRSEVIASQPTDWRNVVRQVTGPVPGDKPVWYQKHMTHHMLPHYGLEWTDGMANCFLIRDPAHVVASYAAKREEVTAADLGFHRQVELFDRVCDRQGSAPPVLDSADILKNPEGMLSALCDRIGIPFDKAMLSWPAGARDSDGVWAAHWYASVDASTGFMPYVEKEPVVPDTLKSVYDACLEPYNTLVKHRLIV